MENASICACVVKVMPLGRQDWHSQSIMPVKRHIVERKKILVLSEYLRKTASAHETTLAPQRWNVGVKFMFHLLIESARIVFLNC